jgi:hypothetical protein
MAQEVKFEVPDGMVVRGGVAAIVGYSETGEDRLIIATVEEPPLWVQASILESAARRTVSRMDKAWSG